MFISETNNIKVADSYDVIVCGGGFGGMAAALAAARQGKKTLLMEKEYMLGGLGTAGLVTIYLPLCDGMGHQVCYGITEELFRLSVSMGWEERYPENWLDGIGTRTEKDKRFLVRYNAQLFAMLAEKLLLTEGVEILYGTYAVSVKKDGDKISHIIAENKSGRQAFAVKSVVDATGDCDIALFADAPTETFKQGNVLAAWYYFLGKEGYDLHELGFCDVPDEDKTEDVPMLINRRFSGLDGKEISEQVCLSHQSTMNDLIKRRKEDPTIMPVTIATIPQLRMTRRIAGEYELCSQDIHTYCEDSIGMVPSWRERGPIYEVPFRTLYNHEVKNLICAGRCVSATEKMWDIMRVIPSCAVTGEAAGIAAAMTDDFASLDVKELQKKLVEAGVKLHESDIL
ncbi:MAG: FAD-dependent oxidoreductase [Clostridia bacterium]|nr:FAD-dependent oxidoreductase [Clostridia bacterium]